MFVKLFLNVELILIVLLIVIIPEFEKIVNFIIPRLNTTFSQRGPYFILLVLVLNLEYILMSSQA